MPCPNTSPSDRKFSPRSRGSFFRNISWGLFFLLTAATPRNALGEKTVREPSVAGSFYPADPEELEALIRKFLAEAPAPEASRAGATGALIVPHAGYVYSGRTAAYGYKLLEGQEIDTVVILGPAHRGVFPGASVWARGAWKTPLGEVPVDEELAGRLLGGSPAFRFMPEAHEGEHSIEVQIPFLQTVLRRFKVLPIAVSDDSPENTERLGRELAAGLAGRRALLVASTDMSHYHPLERARVMDRETLEILRLQNSERLSAALRGGRSELCGAAAVLMLLQALKIRESTTRLEVLHYDTSAAASGNSANVVGYGASAVFDAGEEAETGGFSPEEKQELLVLARRTLEAFVRGEKIPDFEIRQPNLKAPRAVFVTLRKKGELRGCIGRTLAEEPLYLAVRNRAVEAATRDTRFHPVQPGELGEIDIEISVLSPPEKVTDPAAIFPGRHGVMISKGTRGGVFLPKVAAETGWSRETFLRELCSQKAGLPPDCWKNPEAEIFIFTAEDFSEADFMPGRLEPAGNG